MANYSKMHVIALGCHVLYVHFCFIFFAQDFWSVVVSDPRGESVDKGNGKQAFDSVSSFVVSDCTGLRFPLLSCQVY